MSKDVSDEAAFIATKIILSYIIIAMIIYFILAFFLFIKCIIAYSLLLNVNASYSIQSPNATLARDIIKECNRATLR